MPVRWRGMIVMLALAVLAGVAVDAPPAPVQSGIGAGQRVRLSDMLKNGLRARRPADVAFIDDVVDLVQQKVLPESLVKSTFHWARSKRPHPFVYFERALKLRAKRLGITL